MYIDGKILIGKNLNKELFIVPSMANRHGLITGASGSGKTITLKVMAESFSSMGVPVFLSDIKGDLSGTCMPGESNEKIEERLNSIGIENFEFKGFPVVFWDVFKKSGHPIRTSIQSVGATILSRMLGLNDTQEAVLAVIFKIAKEEGYEIIDIKDLRIILQYVSENSKEYTVKYGNVATQSIGSIQRSLIALEEQGGDDFFGEPAIDIKDFFNFNDKGLGNINILHCVELYKNPNLYACFLLWILSTLNSNLPEVGDMDKPKMVFFFDEAHLLFDNLPSYILTSVIQIVKLIRSKGVGLYFISQSPNDIPEQILAQLGNKIQHNLRAYTPAEQRAINAISDSFRANPEFDTKQAILSLGTGEALISFLNEKGEPNIVEKATILPPQSMMGEVDEPLRLMVISRSIFHGKYDTVIDRESAFEILSEEIENKKAEEEAIKREKEEQKLLAQKQKEEDRIRREEIREQREADRIKKQEEREAEKARKNSIEYKIGKAAGRVGNAALSTIGRKAANELFKNLFK